MCGFAGVVSWDERIRTSPETLARMSAAVAHRGPDGEGLWFNHDGPITPDRPQVAMAFRRLAILDCDARAMQPMHSPDGRYTLVFNGEIYNFRDLKSEISDLRPDYPWRTTGDSEVLLMAYATWGADCLHKFNGMFAFAVWDEQEKRLYLGRDRMGQKPLYFTTGEHTVGFSSEFSALDGLGDVSRDRNERGFEDFLAYGCFGPCDSVCWGVEHLPPGLLLTVGGPLRHGRRYDRYFDDIAGRDVSDSPEAIAQAARDAAIARALGHQPVVEAPPPPPDLVGPATPVQVRRAVETAVRRQLVSDVPLGVFLSGGVDSSVIALCARKHGSVQTFSIGFDDPRYDESPYAREVAKHLGTEHHEFRVTPNVIEDLPKLVRVFGEPFADSSMIPTHYLARETRKHVKVALSGDGGDELFGGYDRYVAMSLASRWSRFVPRFAATSASSWAPGHPKSKLTRAARFVASLGLSDAERYDSYMRIFDDATIDALLVSRPDQQSHRGVAGTYSTLRRDRGPVEAALATDRVTYLPNDLLTKVDRCSMLHALEVRSPFMDHEVVQLAAGLTEEQLLKGGKKRMLREAFAHELPASVFNRPKMGFAVPIGEWFRGELRSFLRDHLFASDSFGREHFDMKVVERLVDEHETGCRDHSQRLFALLVLELWWKQTREGTA